MSDRVEKAPFHALFPYIVSHLVAQSRFSGYQGKFEISLSKVVGFKKMDLCLAVIITMVVYYSG